MTQAYIEMLGLFAGGIGLIAWVPQLHTVYVKKLHEGVDLRTLFIILVALCIWCVYGYLLNAWAVCLSNMCSGTVVVAIIYKVMKLRR